MNGKENIILMLQIKTMNQSNQVTQLYINSFKITILIYEISLWKFEKHNKRHNKARLLTSF